MKIESTHCINNTLGVTRLDVRISKVSDDNYKLFDKSISPILLFSKDDKRIGVILHITNGKTNKLPESGKEVFTISSFLLTDDVKERDIKVFIWNDNKTTVENFSNAKAKFQNCLDNNSICNSFYDETENALEPRGGHDGGISGLNCN